MLFKYQCKPDNNPFSAQGNVKVETIQQKFFFLTVWHKLLKNDTVRAQMCESDFFLFYFINCRVVSNILE